MTTSSSGAILAHPKPEHGMDLLLWRHAEAEDGTPDLSRRLTRRGEKQAAALARWLKKHHPPKLRIIASPATRTQQTVAAFTAHCETSRKLAPGGCVADLLAAAGWPDGGGAVLLVGHQPALGQLAALLLSGAEANWTIKKGALWWFSNRVREGETQTVLRAAITPEMLDSD
jgi:phosphohistidine phosphatase